MAQETTIFESCTDSRGMAVAVSADDQQAVLVRSVDESGRHSIRYNPEVLPRLTRNGRLFFYAHQCALHGLEVKESEASIARARAADCLGLDTLLGAGLLKYGDLAALQTELAFSDAEWALLPGPRRNIDLTACRAGTAGGLRLPPAAGPSERQQLWNSCQRACGDRLWVCQKSCGRSDCAECLAAHGQCRTACGDPPDPLKRR
jgi:hypothetical protein